MPAAESSVAEVRGRHDPAAAAGVPAHVTVLYPFAPPRRIDETLERDLAATFASVAPFEFQLARIGRFPNVVYLAPEPAAPFVALTELVHQRWPAWPPYRGAFSDVVPHLTVCEGEEPPTLAAQMVAVLPIEAAAEQVDLYVEQRDGRWVQQASFPLRGAVSPTR